MSSAPAIATDPLWWTSLLQLGDTFYPTGAYSHSFGLEGLVEQGWVKDRDTLREYLHASLLPSLARLELPLIGLAHAAYGREDWASIARLSHLSSAARVTRELRDASSAIGRQRLALLARLRPSPLVEEHLRRSAAESWPETAPVIAALEARVIGAPVEWALSLTTYGAVSGSLAAAMKILRLGQNAAQALLTEALAQSPALFARAAQLREDQVGWYNPWLDIASARHEHAPARLFIS